MQLKSRLIALPLVAVLASGAFFHTAPAQAAPKSKTYKAGAVALGVLGAYLLSKGKTVEGAAAIGGGYLAYKKGQKESKNEKYGRNYGNDRYGYNGNSNNGGYYNGGYDNGGTYYNGNNNGAYYNGNASYNNRSGNYNNGGDYRYNDSSYDNGDSSNSYNGDDSDLQCRDQGNGSKGRGHAYGHSKNRSWQR